jgi:hypothetical protein
VVADEEQVLMDEEERIARRNTEVMSMMGMDVG